MKSLKALAVVGFFVGAVASASAQIVHLKLETTATFYGEYVSTVTPFYPNTPLSLEIYYEATLPNVPGEEYGWFEPPKNGKNGFRLEVGKIKFERPLDRIRNFGGLLIFEDLWNPEIRWENGEFLIPFDGEFASFELPSGDFPPIGGDVPGSFFFIGPDLVGNTGPNARYNYGSIRFGPNFTLVSVEIVPVPEPSTYGAAALALLAGLVAHRRRQNRRM